MKEWLTKCPQFEPRPVVFVEDRARHVEDLCDALKKEEAYEGELLRRLTVVLLDVGGLDTEFFSAKMLLKFPHLQLVAGPFETSLGQRFSEYESASLRKRPLNAAGEMEKMLSTRLPLAAGALSGRFMDLPADVLLEEASLVRLLDGLIRPGGLMISDVELLTLRFTKAEDVTTILLGVHAASTASRRQADKGTPTQEAARLIVVSNRDYFGTRADRELRERGIDVASDDILRKTKDMRETAQKISAVVRERFPWTLRARVGDRLVELPVGKGDRAVIDANFDAVIWPMADDEFPITGRAIKDGERSLRAATGRAEVLLMLANAHLSRGQVPVPYDDIAQKLEDLREAQSPANVIEGIQRVFSEHGQKIIPRGKDHGYRLADNAKVALVLAG